MHSEWMASWAQHHMLCSFCDNMDCSRNRAIIWNEYQSKWKSKLFCIKSWQKVFLLNRFSCNSINYLKWLGNKNVEVINASSSAYWHIIKTDLCSVQRCYVNNKSLQSFFRQICIIIFEFSVWTKKCLAKIEVNLLFALEYA